MHQHISQDLIFPDFICSFGFAELPSVGSFACPKETNQRKRQPQIFFGLNILSVAHALQLGGLWPPQAVMLTFSLRFATSKMLIYFQKRFVRLFSPDGDLCLFSLCEWATVQSTGFQMASDNFGRKRLFWSLLRRPFVSNTVWPRAKLGGVVLRGQASKQEPQNHLQPWFFFGYFLFIKKKKVTWIWASKRTEQSIKHG